MAVERVKRLRDLVDQIERLPASPDRDRLLSEIRSRAVDIDTGTTPRAMLPMREPEPPPIVPWAPRPERTANLRPMAPPPSAPAAASPQPASPARRSQSAEKPLWADERLLSLEDPPLPYVRGRGGRAIPPWTRGLRG
jgi:hypothetical protein